MATYKENVEYKVSVNDLCVGMFVSNLDRAWEETPFILQGFRITKADQIHRVAHYCNYVYIDSSKSVHYNASLAKSSGAGIKPTLRSMKTKPSFDIHEDWKKTFCVEPYKVTTTFKKELSSAKKVLTKTLHDLHNLLSNATHIKHNHIESINELVVEMTESVLRNPDAMTWLCRVKDFRNPIYLHGIRLAVWGCVCGRQLSLNKKALHELTSALLMSCIGKSFIPKIALNEYDPFNPSEKYKAHLNHTLSQIMNFKLSNKQLVNIVSHYCERIDGSGYPEGKEYHDIPFLAQVAGLVEMFELAVNPYDTKQAVSPSDAIIMLNNIKGTLFTDSLVETFIQSIGIYPTGTIVELNDQRIGIVSSQSYEKRLRANVIVVTTPDKTLTQSKLCELGKEENNQELKPLCIKKGLPANMIKKEILVDAHHHIFEEKTGFWNQLKNAIHA